MSLKSVTAIASAAGVSGLAAFALSPGAASAAATPKVAVTNPEACYVDSYTYSTKTSEYAEHYAHVKVRGSGWTAGTTVQVDFAGSGLDKAVTVHANGSFTASVKVPDPPLGLSHTVHQGSSAVSATDEGSADGSDPGGTTASTKRSFFYADRSVYLWDTTDGDYDGEVSDLGAGDPIRFNAAGFPSGKELYAHYVFTGITGKSKPKLWKTASLGRTSGPCGTFQKSAHVAPSDPPAKLQGDYTVQFDTSKTYSGRTAVNALYHMNLS